MEYEYLVTLQGMMAFYARQHIECTLELDYYVPAKGNHAVMLKASATIPVRGTDNERNWRGLYDYVQLPMDPQDMERCMIAAVESIAEKLKAKEKLDTLTYNKVGRYFETNVCDDLPF